jgi:hypothetical protein
MHVAFEETQNDNFFEILNDMNENVQHLSLNNKIFIETNNKGIEKNQSSSSNQLEIGSNYCVPPKELRHVSSYPSKLIIDNHFEGTIIRVSLKNISLCIYFSNRT